MHLSLNNAEFPNIDNRETQLNQQQQILFGSTLYSTQTIHKITYYLGHLVTYFAINNSCHRCKHIQRSYTLKRSFNRNRCVS